MIIILCMGLVFKPNQKQDLFKILVFNFYPIT